MRRTLSAVVALLSSTALLVTLTGCLATTDEAAGWREDARVAAGDTHSQLMTVRLVLVERDGLLGRYDATVVRDAEEAVGTASDDLAKSQPPRALRPTYDRLTTLLDDAGSLVAEARTAVGERDTSRYADLVRRIERLAPRVERMEKELRG